MKIAIAAAFLSLTMAFPAGAAEFHAPAGSQPTNQGYACERGPVNRVAFTAPAPCCAGQLVCSQFLSTGTMVHPRGNART